MTEYDIISTTKLYDAHIFTVTKDRIRIPSGKETTRTIIQHRGASAFIPQCDDGSLLLVSQYRHAIRSTILEFPAGIIEQGETPLECAQREICEEVNFAAATWSKLGDFYSSPGFCDEKLYGFFAKDLTPRYAEGDEDEIIEVKNMTVEEVERAIIEGDITDGKTIILFTYARMRGLI